MRQINQIRAAIAALLLSSLCSISFSKTPETMEPVENEVETTPEHTWPSVDFKSAEERGDGFATNESYTFRMQWGMFRKAGTTSIKTESIPSPDGSIALSVTTRTKSHGLVNSFYPITLETVAILDPKNWRLDKASMQGKEGKRLRDMETVFDYDDGVMRHVDRNYPDRTGLKKLPYPVPLDDSSALLQVRGWDMTLGNKHPLLVCSKGKLYLLEMRVTEKESLKTAFGKREAYRIEPISAYPESKLFREGGHFTIWISADAERIPLRFDVKTNVGIASMLLEAFEINRDSLVARK